MNNLLVKLSIILILIILPIEYVLAGTISQKQPNIILILADDVSPDKFGVFNQPAAVKTPNIDQLAEQGVAFKTAYATAMCGPTRVQIMTGRYANYTGVYHNSIWLNNSHKDVYSHHDNFALAVKNAGYKTAIIGKWHAGKQMPNDKELAFDEYALWVSDKAATQLGDNSKFNGAYENHKTPSRYWNPSYSVNGKRLKTKASDFSLDIEADFAIDFAKRQHASNQPFLIYWPTVAPHGTRKGHTTTPFRGEVGEMGKANKTETAARFDALIEYMDYSIGRVVKAVEEMGIADNTVIIFTSDNGTAVTAKTRGVERGPHVVTLFSGKNVLKRGLSDELVDFTDIAPTLVDMAYQKPVADNYRFDGVSLKSYLNGETDKHRDWIYGYISGSQIFRTKDYLLEVVNPMLDMPAGRLYYTGDNRFQRGYQRITKDQPRYQQAMKIFEPLMAKYKPLTVEHVNQSTQKRAKKFLKEYLTEKSRNKHLHNHRDYQFYDESD